MFGEAAGGEGSQYFKSNHRHLQVAYVDGVINCDVFSWGRENSLKAAGK